MKTRYRILARRKTSAPRRIRLRSCHGDGMEPVPDDPMEMPAERIDVTTGELLEYPVKRRFS